MTVRFARHGNKSEMDPSPSPCEEEWVHLHPVAFEVRVCAAPHVAWWWMVAATHCCPPCLVQDGEADAVRQLLFFQGDAELSFFTASCRWG